MGGTQNAKRSTFESTLARELLDAIHFPAWSSGASAPQTFTLTPASYSHSTSTSLHSIGFINYFHLIFFLVEEDFFKVPRGHIKAPPGHLKETIATSKGYASLFIPIAAMGKCKQINNSNSP